MHCTLLVPDLLLFSPAPDAGLHLSSAAGAGLRLPSASDAGLYSGLHLPALTRLLARGRPAAADAPGMEAWLCRAFAVERQHDWPVAPLTLIADGGDPGDSYWLRCDPAHLRADRSRLLLAAGPAIAPTPHEAAALIAALNAHFAVDGLAFSAPHPEHWYLRLAHAPALLTHPLPDVIGHNIDDYLPQGSDGMRWHQRLNEIQMLLHAHPVNAAREALNRPAINTVWPWGGGIEPVQHGSRYSRIWSDDALALGLAAASDIASRSAIGGAASLLAAAADSKGNELAVLPQLRSAAANADLDGWRAGLQALENDWFAPLHDALRQRQLSGLSIVAPGAERTRRYDTSAVDLWKFWRPLRPLAQHG